MWTFAWIEEVVHDLRYARRMLARSPAFSATTVVTLALGIGASTVIFSVVDAVLLSPLEYNDPDHIYRVHTFDTQGLPRGSTGPAHIDPLNDDYPSVAAAAYGYSLETSVVNQEGTAFAVSEYRVSDGFFDVFTDPLSQGRGFEPGEHFSSTILSHQTWRDIFDSDPDIVGSVIRVSGSELNVIGVAGPGFEFPAGTAMWTMIFTGPATQGLFNMEAYARASPGVSHAQFQAALDSLASQLGPWGDGRPLRFFARPLLEDVVGDFGSTLLIIFGATAILLLIACLNVANLLFTHGVVRASEIALREALGAKGWRVFRQLMTESFLLCSLGGLLGLGLALIAVRVLRAVGPDDLPRFDTVAIDPNVFLFAAACILLTTFVVGIAPALRVSRSDLSRVVNEGSRTGFAGPGRNRVFGTLVVAEIALAVMLVIAAGLLVRSYSLLTSTDPGFRPDRMLTFVLNVPGRLDLRAPVLDADGNVTGYEGTGYLPVARFYQELTARIEALPGVAAAGAASSAPLHAGLFPVNLAQFPLVGDPADGTGERRLAYGNQVAPEYFAALDVRPVAGRLLDANDRRDAPGVAVVNQTFARTYFDEDNPLGRRIVLPGQGAWRLGGVAFQLGERLIDEVEIVGVIPDLKQGHLADPVEAAIYMPQEQWTLRRMAVLVRADIDEPASLIPGIRRELAAMDPSIPAAFAVYPDLIAASVARQRLGAALLVVFGVVSLTLAAVGIFGLVSFSVNQRVSEIAVRSAMGAERGSVLKMFVVRALRLAGVGIVLGLGGAIALREVIATQLHETSALDPRVLAVVPLTMLAVALLASYLPARRASRIEPSAALRTN